MKIQIIKEQNLLIDYAEKTISTVKQSGDIISFWAFLAAEINDVERITSIVPESNEESFHRQNCYNFKSHGYDIIKKMFTV